jgi:hypothetical protein
MRHVVFLLLLVATSSAAHAALPYCDAPPTELHRVICTSGDGKLTRRATRLVDLAARYVKYDPAQARKLDADLQGFFRGTGKACLGKKNRIPCIYDAFDRKLVALSTRLIDTNVGVAPGRYRYSENPSVEGELVFLRDEDGGASVALETNVVGGTNVCVVEADGMQVSPFGFDWSAKDDSGCRFAVDVGKKAGELTIKAWDACEPHYCGNGAIFTGTWTIRK